MVGDTDSQGREMSARFSRIVRASVMTGAAVVLLTGCQGATNSVPNLTAAPVEAGWVGPWDCPNHSISNRLAGWYGGRSPYNTANLLESLTVHHRPTPHPTSMRPSPPMLRLYACSRNGDLISVDPQAAGPMSSAQLARWRNGAESLVTCPDALDAMRAIVH